MKSNHNNKILLSLQRIISKGIQKIDFSKLIRSYMKVNINYLCYMNLNDWEATNLPVPQS